ncbi:MAG: HupE/UreJ family protein [Planctomycetota bacterium]|jgi:urease accessory protein
MMEQKRLLHWSAWAVLLAWPAAAYAHTSGTASGFTSGLSHPVSGLDHVMAMIAVGIWGAQLGMPAVWVLPVAFPMVMAGGALLGLLGFPVPGVELGIAISAVVLGAMILLEARPPLVVALIMVGFFAIFHGNAHGTELPEGESGLLYSIGFVIATGLLHGVGILIGLIQHWTAGHAVLRFGGAIVAGFGCFFLYRAVT